MKDWQSISESPFYEKANAYVEETHNNDCTLEAFIDGAESRQAEIEELERKLEQTEKDLADYQFNYPTIKELQKENAELKEKLERAERARDYWKNSSFDWRHKCTSRRPFRVAVKAQKQLTKAKELLKEFVHHYKDKTIYIENMQDLLEQAEQFLKESG